MFHPLLLACVWSEGMGAKPQHQLKYKQLFVIRKPPFCDLTSPGLDKYKNILLHRFVQAFDPMLHDFSSFVNNINTIKGRTHVDYITGQITKFNGFSFFIGCTAHRKGCQNLLFKLAACFNFLFCLSIFSAVPICTFVLVQMSCCIREPVCR